MSSSRIYYIVIRGMDKKNILLDYKDGKRFIIGALEAIRVGLWEWEKGLLRG
jgi:hypothetical protein